MIHFDAHRDLLSEYMGERFSHITWAYHIARNPGFRLVQIGCRSWSREEETNLKQLRVLDKIGKLAGPIYLSVDMDVFDPALVPAVGTPEPGGIGWYETLSLFKEVAKDKKVVGFDIVELCPIQGNIASDFFAAKLIYRLLGYIFPAKK